MFAESTPLCLYRRSLYLYIMNIPLSPFLSPYIYYTISIYKREHSFPAPYLSRYFLTFIYSFIIYTLYTGNTLSRNFYPFSHSFIILLIYRTLCPPLFSSLLYTLIKWTHLHRHFLYLFEMLLMGKVCGEKFLKTLLV